MNPGLRNNRRLRIGHFLSHYPGPGGMTTALRGLCRAMVPLGWQAFVYCCPGGGNQEPEEESDGVYVVRFSKPHRNPFAVDPRLLKRLSRNQDDIDLLLIHGMYNPPNVSIAKTARDAGIPYVAWLHGTFTPEVLRKNRVRKLLYGRLFERPLLNGALAVHVLAEQHAEYLKDYGVRVPAFAVPNGFDPEEVPESHCEEAPSGRGDGATLNFLFLGRLHMHGKGLDLLLKALSTGIRNGELPTNLRLDLVGADWGDKHRLENLAARLRIADFVRFPGYAPPAERWNVLSSHDILVLPSRWEGFGLVVLEAMVLGKPVLVSQETGAASFVMQAQCGYLVQPNPASICAGLVRAIETRDQWRSMGERGRTFAYQHLTWGKVAEQATHALEEILSLQGAKV
jgi:glycosyltransferase involved in cell wall biosynthesis